MAEFKTAVSFCIIITILGCSPELPPVVDRQIGESIRKYVTPFEENRDFSGIIAVSHSGILLGEEAFGYLNFENIESASSTDTFHIASITKTFTAAAIQVLVIDGQLEIEDSLANYLPTFPNSDKITIRHLLAHQSGIPDYWSLADVGDFTSRNSTLDELVTWLGEKPLDFEPGSNSSYSNSGYLVLASVIEKLSGQDYYSFLAEHVYPTAELENTTAFEFDADSLGYQPAFEPIGVAEIREYDPSILIGAGSLKSNSQDLISWCNRFNADYLDPETPEFVYGWGARENGGRRWAEQTGRNPGYSAHIRAYPNEQLCIVVLSNIESQAVEQIGSGVAEIAFGQSPTPPELRKPFEISAELLEDYPGNYEIEPGVNVTIRLTSQGLELRGQNGEFLPFEAIDNDYFFYRQLYIEIGVERDNSGQVTGLLWGGTYSMPRVD